MNKLVILDYSVGTVDIYNVADSFLDNIEDYLSKELEYNLEHCEWMVGELDITYHKKMLK